MRFQLLLCLSALILTTSATLICQNGGTFDEVRYECTCDIYHYGSLCETSFTSSDPCANWSSVPVISDSKAVHRLGNTEKCVQGSNQSCVDFSLISTGWYRLVSPAGGYLVIGSPTGATACGSKSAYFLLNQTIVQEGNANRMLFQARAHRYRPGRVGGFLERDTSYPVRILKCFSELTLYYLQGLPSTLAHYCIGSKQPCNAGLTSVEGTGFEPCIQSDCLPRLMKSDSTPKLRLDYKVHTNGFYKATFKCNVFAAFDTNASDSNGVLHRIEFELTFRNGTSVPIERCQWQDERIRAGENKTFECPSVQVLTIESNVYGGSLVCRVQAKCDIARSEYNSMIVTSNVHGFYFRHWFQDGSDVIKPGELVTLCIDSMNIPVLSEVEFFVSVGRQQVIVSDRIEVSVLRRDGNESLSCGFLMMNTLYLTKTVCQDLVLYNRDDDNKIPLGLAEGDQLSTIQVNVSFQSAADGLFTVFANGSACTQDIQKIKLQVDLTSLQTNVTTYLHVYTDPAVKPAQSAYTSSQFFQIHGGVYTALKHKVFPYEIQLNVDSQDWYTSEVAIRYYDYTIRIYGDSSIGLIQPPIVAYRPPKSRANNGKDVKLKLKQDGLPFGVTMENAGFALKFKFDLFGTIIYVWGFATYTNSPENLCFRDFIMRHEALKTATSCKASFKRLPNGRIVLELMVIPGFYDTVKFTEGLLYGSDRSPIHQPSMNMFHPEYSMPEFSSYSHRVQPTEVLSICSCNGKDVTKTHCFVDVRNAKRNKHKREVKETPSGVQQSNFQPTQTRKVSQQEADEFCNSFVQLQLSKSVSTEICSETKDPTGQADYITQFKVVCAQYATVLGTFDSTQSLFNSMLGLCYTEMTYNATVVLGNSSKIEALVEDLCPENCSGRGDCLSGECRCADGFWGASCEYEKAKLQEIPIEIQLLQRSVFCPSDNCTAAYLSVKPLLRSSDSVCNIQMNSSVNYTAPSVYISGDIVKCELREQHQQLVKEEKMFALLEISVTASSWVSNNAVTLLLHQTRCGGRPVLCSSDSLTCRASEPSTKPADDGANLCLPDVAKLTDRLRAPRLMLLILAVLSAMFHLE